VTDHSIPKRERSVSSYFGWNNHKPKVAADLRDSFDGMTNREEARNKLVETVASFIETAQRLGKRAELEARLGCWNATSGSFRPGMHLRALGTVQRFLDSFPGWEGKTGWMHSRDSFYRTTAKTGRSGDQVVRCELGGDASVRNTWKRKMGKIDAVIRVPAGGAGASADVASDLPWEEVPDADGTCLSAYGVRFSLAAEETVEPPLGRSETKVTFVRYKTRRSWLWGPVRYDLTVVWASDELSQPHPRHESEGKWSPSEQAETQLASGIPSSVELEVEFDPNHSSCAGLFDGNAESMARAFVDQVATLVHHDAELYASSYVPRSSGVV
jgi:hypothetical protein